MRGEDWAALGFSLLTSTIVFVRRLLVFNKWGRRSITQAASYPLSLLSGATFWVSVRAVRGTAALQFAAGAVSTTLSWCVMVLLVNDTPRIPTRQQWLSLVFYLLTELSILLQVRLILA